MGKLDYISLENLDDEIESLVEKTADAASEMATLTRELSLFVAEKGRLDAALAKLRELRQMHVDVVGEPDPIDP